MESTLPQSAATIGANPRPLAIANWLLFVAGLVFLMVTIPMLNWLNATAGPIGNGLLFRMLAAPLVAALFVGMIVASLIARTTARGLERHDHS